MRDDRICLKKFFITLLEAYRDDVTSTLDPRIRRERKALKERYANA